MRPEHGALSDAARHALGWWLHNRNELDDGDPPLAALILGDKGLRALEAARQLAISARPCRPASVVAGAAAIRFANDRYLGT